MATAKPKKTVDAMENFTTMVQKDPTLAIQLMFWKARHQNPDFSVEITRRDVDGFRACVDYLNATPTIQIFQPGGTPATEPQAAVGERGAIPGRPARPPRPTCVVQMTDTDGNAIVPIEDNEQDQAAGRQAQSIRMMHERGPALAGQITQMLAGGGMSNELIMEACATLRTLGPR